MLEGTDEDEAEGWLRLGGADEKKGFRISSPLIFCPYIPPGDLLTSLSEAVKGCGRVSSPIGTSFGILLLRSQRTITTRASDTTPPIIPPTMGPALGRFVPWLGIGVVDSVGCRVETDTPGGIVTFLVSRLLQQSSNDLSR